MAPKLPYMPFYGRDYEADERVRMLDDAGHGIYLRLLWHQWAEGSVPSEPEKVAKLLGSTDVVRIGQILATFFQVNGNDRAHNPKLLEIRRELEAVRAAQSNGGKKGRRKQLGSEPKPTRKRAQTRPQVGPGIPEPDTEPEPLPSAPPRARASEPGLKDMLAALALDPEGETALKGLMRASQSPLAVVAELHAIATGLRPLGVAVTPPDLSLALQDLVLAGGQATGAKIRAFVRRAVEDRSRAASAQPLGEQNTVTPANIRALRERIDRESEAPAR